MLFRGSPLLDEMIDGSSPFDSILSTFQTLYCIQKSNLGLDGDLILLCFLKRSF